jgi:biotin-(acetyl-CoA carboxylase) ligase
LTEPLQLPPAFRLAIIDAGDDVRLAAAAMARQPTDDGTLVWAPPGDDKAGSDDNLRFALVLYPESDLLSASQLVLVTALGLADGLGVVLPGGSQVTFEWPGVLLLNGGRVAEITLDYPAAADAGSADWVVVGANLYISRPPGSSLLDTATLRDEGWPEATAAEVLKVFGRHFLSWVNRWQDDGFDPVRRVWLGRTTLVGQAVEIALEKSLAGGTFVDLDGDGRLVLEAKNGRRRKIEIRQTRYASALAE